jgi:hypothetical protein
MDRVNTIGLALGNDETCHAGQKERKGKSGRETHFDGVKISKWIVDILEAGTLKLLKDQKSESDGC